ncbi:MAG: YrdB family protein [Thermoleophilia bacterium]
MSPLSVANAALAFLVEAAMLVLLAWWGFALDAPVAARIAAGLGAPALAALVWARFLAPARRGRGRLEMPWLLIVKAVLFAAAAAAIWSAGHRSVAVAFAVATTVHLVAGAALREL